MRIRGPRVTFFISLVFVLIAGFPTYALSVSVTADTEEQRRRAQQDAEERQRQQQAPDVRLPAATSAGEESFDLPAEQPCFPIARIRLDGDKTNAFAWATDYLAGYAGQCIGRDGMNTLIKRLSNRLIDQGYITTRVGIPEQDLSQGELKLVLVPGIIRAIRFADPSQAGNWQTAFPIRPGDLLNLRDLEQGLEQLKRVPSQDANFDIVPGEAPGESDIVITVTRSKPWRIGVSLDDSGAKATGRRQASLNLSLDNPLGLNDLFTAGINNDAEGSGTEHGTRSNSLGYSMPWGNWTAALATSSSDFHQTIQGINQRFISSGTSSTAEAKLSRIIQRSQNSKTSLQLRIAKRHSKSYLEDAEIEAQRRNTTLAELGLIQRHYIGAAQIDLTLAHREGVPWFGGQQDQAGLPDGSPTFRYRMQTLDVALMLPFKVGEQSLRWLGAFRSQTTSNALYSADFFAIGNRWTVRGFDGEQTLSAERGWYLRNEIEWTLGDSGQALFAGLDHGRVGGPSADYLPGRSLTGIVAGLRGGGKGFTYDVFVGTPVKKPNGLTASTTSGFQLNYQY